MWNRFHGVNLKDVAGNLRKQASEFATEVVKQAKTLAEEEEELEDENFDSPHSHDTDYGSYHGRQMSSETRYQNYVSQQNSPKSGPHSHPSASHRYPDSKSEALPSPGEHKSLPDVANDNDVRKPGVGSSEKNGDSRVQTRIEALKAKMKADKAKRDAAAQSSEGRKGPLTPPTQKNPDDSLPARGSEQSPVQVDSDNSTATPSTNSAASPSRSPEPHQQAQKEKFPSEPQQAESPARSSDPAQNPSQVPSWHRLQAWEALMRSDDFVEVPLHTPHSSVQLQSRTNGSLHHDETQDANPTDGVSPGKLANGSNEVSQLKAQLQRLKVEMVNNVMAQEEEQAMLHEELQKKSAEVKKLQGIIRQSQNAEEDSCSIEEKDAAVAQAQAAWGAKMQQTYGELEAKDKIIAELKRAGDSLRQQMRSNNEAIAELQQENLQLKALQAPKLPSDVGPQGDDSSQLEAALQAERVGHEKTREEGEEARRQLETLRRAAESSGADQSSEGNEAERLQAERTARLAAEEEVQALRSKCETLQQSLEDITEEMQSKNADFREAVQDMAQDLQEKDSQLRSKDAELQVLRADASGASTQLQERLSSLEMQTRQKSNQLSEAEAALRELQQREVVNLQQIQELKSTTSQFEEHRANSQAAKQELQAAVTEAERNLAKLGQQYEEKLQIEKTGFESREVQMLQELTGTMQQLEHAHREIEKLRQLSASSSQSDEQLRQDNAAREEQCRTLTKKLLEAESQVSSVPVQLQHMRSERDELRGKVESLESLVEADKKLVLKLEEDIHDSGKTIQQLRREAQTKDSHLAGVENLRKQVLSLEGTIGGLEDDLAAERAHASGLQQSLEAAMENPSRADSHDLAALQSKCDTLQRQLLSSQATTSRLQAELDHQTASQSASQPPFNGSSAEVLEMRKTLESVAIERDKAKQQLTRLKQQMVKEQEDEDEKVRWRVEAEVQSALKLASSAQEAAELREGKLRKQLEAAQSQVRAAESDLAAWEKAVAERDVELQNLQGALGELTFETEAAERLRTELRAEKQHAHQLQADLRTAKVRQEGLERAKAGAESLLKDREQQVHNSTAREQRHVEEINMLQRAVRESMRKIEMLSSDSNAMVDRRIVVNLMTTYLQKGHSEEVLNLMARILGLTEQERLEIKNARKGALRNVAAVPLNLVSSLARANSSANSHQDLGNDSFTSSWVEFLHEHASDGAEAQSPKSALAESRAKETQAQ